MNKIGKYEIRSELGRGAMGVVYLGYDPIIERPVAIKTMNAESFGNEEQKQRFLREARSAGAMQHPHIVTIYEMGMEGETPYIAMEYVAGQDLTELIKKGEPELLNDKLAIMSQLCDALDFAHTKSIIHRDIKPGNIRILPDGTVKIMDFGIAKKQDSDFTRTGLVVGTLSYMSPEQVQGKPLDPRSDQFSAGVVFYQMLTGKKPFGGENLTNVIYQIISFNVNALELPGTPTVLKKIVQKMMNPDPKKRFKTCGEVCSLLRQEMQYLQGEGEAPTVMMERETLNETVVPLLPTEGANSSMAEVHRAVKKKNTLAVVFGVLLFLGILALAGILGYRKFLQPRPLASVTENAKEGENNSTNIQPSKIPISEAQGRENEENIQTQEETASLEGTKLKEESQKETANNQPEIRQVYSENQKRHPESLGRTVGKEKAASLPETVEKNVEIRPEHSKATPKQSTELQAPAPVKVFKKEGQGLQILALHKVFASYAPRIEKFKKRVVNMPMGQRRSLFSREINMGRMALGNNNKVPAAVHFYRSIILQPKNKDGYSWLIATLVDMKAYEDAKNVIKKATSNGIYPSNMNNNMRFRMAYQKLQMH